MYQIEYSKKFEKQFKELCKKYPHCGQKIKECIEKLEKGELLVIYSKLEVDNVTQKEILEILNDINIG